VFNGLVMVNGYVYVPPVSTSLHVILESAHDSGHEGLEKMLHRLHTDFHLPGARWLVREFVRSCTVCQRNKMEHLHPTGLLQLLEVPSSVWSDVAMDFIEGFPCIKWKSIILTVMDRFSK
jgi:hypothetical protein